MKKAWLYMVLLLVPFLGMNQSLSNLQSKSFICNDSTWIGDYFYIPHSEKVFNEHKNFLSGFDYQFNYVTGWFYLLNDSLSNSQITILFRVFPFEQSTLLHSNPAFFTERKKGKNSSTELGIQSRTQEYEQKQGIKASGTLLRGLQVGNNQNMVLNSDLNLQLSGNLTEEIKLEAVLSDKNIPIQPEGYSQQINEFDQIYIRLYDSTHFLQIGDVAIKAANSYFLQFNRKLMGADVTVHKRSADKKYSNFLQASAAIAKGNFHRMTFNGIEGTQGPYPLKGANNETYVVVLAGTEKIYVDGELLERGEQADYVLNYNTGELTFNTRRMITANSRIIAEFEYSDKNYNRFLLYSQNRMVAKKWNFGISYFNEADAKNQPVNQSLTTRQKEILALSGDNTLQAWAPNFDSVAFTTTQVLYKLIDTLVSGIWYDSVLVYSTHVDSAFYSAGFAFVGTNLGNYVREISATNGKIFKWVAPVGKVPQGSYEPLQLLVAPQKKQMMVANTRFVANNRLTFETEWAFSEKDKNTFSALDDSDNMGWALKNQMTYQIPVRSSEFKWRVIHEFTHARFNPIERFRKAEFERDWNLLSAFTKPAHFVQSQFYIPSVIGEKQQLNAEWLQSGTDYRGFRGGFNSSLQLSKFSETLDVSLLNSAGAANNTRFYRHRVQVYQNIGALKLGMGHQFEENQITLYPSDSLLDDSHKFSLAGISLQSGDSLQNQWMVGYTNRLDFLPQASELKKVSQADDILLHVQLYKNPKNKLTADFTWRHFQVLNTELLPGSNTEQNLLAKLDHQWQSRKNGISLQSYYEIGTGLENKKEYSFIEVSPGQGVFCWVDSNGDEIAELDEFEISPFPEEANYLKVYIPTNDYIKVYSVKWSENFKLDPRKWWIDPKGFQKLAARFSNNLNYRVQQKHTQSNIWSRLNPVMNQLPDSSLMSASAQFRNTLSFNRNQRIFGADLSISRQFQKSLLANGSDKNQIDLQELKIRWNMTSELVWINHLQHSQRKNASEYFTSKNYRINGYENSASFQWQPNPKFRTSLTYVLKDKETLDSDEQVFWNEISPEVKINSPKKGTFTLNASVIVNQFKGDETGSVAYQLLEGYAPGENYRWTLQWTRNLNQFLRFSLNYQGRKPAGLPAIHTGQVSVSAYF